MQTIFDKSLHTQTGAVVTHFYTIAKIFKKSTLKFSVFKYKIGKIAVLSALGAPDPDYFLYYSHTAILEKYLFIDTFFERIYQI